VNLSTYRRAPEERQTEGATPSTTANLTDPVIDPHSGVTKGDLVEYYAQVSSLMLPHLRDRPVALLHAPGVVDASLTLHKHPQTREVPGVEQFEPAVDLGHHPLMTIPAQRGLLAAVRMNAIEFHTLNATAPAVERPDRVVFDIDPGEGVPWSTVRNGALVVRDLLGALGLTSFVKTSGGKGLHVLVPLRSLHGWRATKGFAQVFAQYVADTLPARFVAKSGPKNRIGKIFLDFRSNGFGASTVCAWSARALPGMGVSVPVGWEELAGIEGPAQWTVRTIASRVAIGHSAWPGYRETRQDLTAAIRALRQARHARAPQRT
jgi:bifunctional non-homologous end joining protein LigD